MKSLALTTACLLASTLMAAKKQPTPPPEPTVTKQCCHDRFKESGITYGFFAEYLYLQPNGSDLYYAAEAIGLDESIAVPVVSPNWKVKEINPNYHSGFEVGAHVSFNITDFNLALSWERLHGHDSASFTASSAPGFMVGPFFDIGPNSVEYKVAKGKARFQFDGVDLRFGKELCFFKNFYLQFFAGASYTRIHQSLTSTYSNLDNPISRTVKYSSTFWGAGPQMGLDYKFRIYHSFFFTGNSTFSLYMGRLQNDNSFKSRTPELAILGIPQPNHQKTTVPNRTQLVPGFEQKLGFSYVATWDKVRALFEIGYQCQIYLDAVQTVDMTAPQVLPALAPTAPDVGVFAVGFERTLSNYILTGLYATVGIDF